MITVEDVFGSAPTLTHADISGGAQYYGASSLPGAPVDNTPSFGTGDKSLPRVTVPDINNNVPGGNADVSGGTGGSTLPYSGGGGRIAPPTHARDVDVPSVSVGDRSLPRYVATVDSGAGGADNGGSTSSGNSTDTSTPEDTTGASSVIDKLIALAASQQGSAGGGGGLVALPTGIDTSGTTSGSSGISATGIVFIVGLIAVAIYFYSRHKKKKEGESK